MKAKTFLSAAVRQFIALALCSAIVAPLYMVFINSVKNKRESNIMSVALPEAGWFWENYKTVFEKGKLAESFFNSCLYSLTSSICIVLIAALATYVISRRASKLANRIYLFIIIGLFLPVNYVSLIKIMSMVGLYGTRIGIILYYLGANMSFAVFVCYGYFSNIPRELDEAALIDGAGPMRTYISVIFPLLKPICVTIFVLVFMGIWSDFTTPLYLINKTSLWPMNLAIFNFFGKFDAYWNLVFADIVMTLAPVFVVYLICQKQIVGGLTSGAVKG